MTHPEGSVVITPMMQYTELQRLGKAVDKLTETLDPALHQLRSELEDHETRIRAMEIRIWLAMGGASVLSIVGTYVISIVKGF